jgi:hypothetical protein
MATLVVLVIATVDPPDGFVPVSVAEVGDDRL